MDDQYCELYDFDNNEIIMKKSSEFLGIKMTSIIETANFMILEGKNYIIFPFISDNEMIVKKFLFDSKNIQNGVQTINEYNIKNLKKPGKSISCYKTSLYDIFNCFYLDIKQAEGEYYIIVLDENLDKLASTDFKKKIKDENSFYKCVNLKSSLGVFINYELNSSQNKYFPHIKVKYYKIDKKQIVDYIDAYTDVELNYNNVQFNTDLSLNDIIKVEDNKVCFSTTSENKDILYIIIIEVYNNNISIKYYLIEIFNLYNLKFLSDLKLHLYGNFISSGFNFYQDDEEDLYYSGLILFSYANTSDIYLDLTENNNIDINNIIIDLQNNVNIENNIFGLIYKNIRIIEIINCDNVILISTTKNKNITLKDSVTFYNLDKNENIKLEFINNTFYPINCTIKYKYIITEPEIAVYNTYPQKKQIIFGTEKFKSI